MFPALKLIFWTSAKPKAIKRKIGVTLQRMENKPLHKFVPVGDGLLGLESSQTWRLKGVTANRESN